ncbi:unnamed protein product [Pleuronectes platessa]|uniref:Uncharacterized protein n=1 Tax=Pleuronectes platessa TaxID=8262 RepID=A0A9N7YDR0_PLEPL|nr:unnamed protein product [Pleuronectes platessa]
MTRFKDVAHRQDELGFLDNCLATGRCSGKCLTLIGPLLSVRKPAVWGQMSNYRKDTDVQSVTAEQDSCTALLGDSSSYKEPEHLF